MTLHTNLGDNNDSKLESHQIETSDSKTRLRELHGPGLPLHLHAYAGTIPPMTLDFTAMTQPNDSSPAEQQFGPDPMICNEQTAYCTTVGPSQGLFSQDEYMPAKPLNLLMAAATADMSSAEPPSLQILSLQSPEPISGPAAMLGDPAGFEADFAFGAGRFASFFFPQADSAQAQRQIDHKSLHDGSLFAQGFGYAHGIDSTRHQFHLNRSSNYIPSSHTGVSNDELENDDFASCHVGSTVAQMFPSSCLAQTVSREAERPLPASVEQVKYYHERPERPPDKPWVRVNATTMGKTSRTGKINHYDPEQHYTKIPHPLGGCWTTDRGREFRYNQWHELTRDSMSASVLRDFIYQHPRTRDCMLTLYIQRSPADSKRRYPTSTLDKCRLKECPMRVYGGNKGSFLHGHYRVAFDELSYHSDSGKDGATEGVQVDPFLVAGYVHLYCLERFLDLPALCRLPYIRVEADGRHQLVKEPNGIFAPALGDGEHNIAQRFIKAAKAGTLCNTTEWKLYPHCRGTTASANETTSLSSKEHRSTLNYALQMCKNQRRGGRVMQQLKPSNVAVHRGDLEMYCLARKNLLSRQRVAEILQDLEKSDVAVDSRSDRIQLHSKRQACGSVELDGPRTKKVKY